MKRPPRTVVLAAALISGVAVAALILCTTLFLRSYRSAVVEGARTNSAQVVSQVAGAVDNYVNTMDSAVGIVLEQLDSEPAMRDAFLNAFLTARPEVAAITTYDESGSLLDCWAQAGRTPKSDILRNLSFDLTTARRLGHGYISTPHVESIFDSYYPWVVSVIRAVPGDGGSSRWLAVDLSFKELAATINNVSIGQHGYCYLMDERGNMVYHPQQQLLYAGLKKEEAGRLACLGDGTYVEDTVIYSVQRRPLRLSGRARHAGGAEPLGLLRPHGRPHPAAYDHRPRGGNCPAQDRAQGAAGADQPAFSLQYAGFHRLDV